MIERKPILLQINVTVNSGSTGKIAEDIGRIAISRGWRSIIAYGRKSGSSQNELIKIGDSLSINWHGLESRLFDNHGLASVSSTKSFLKRVDAINPDIVHLHNIHGYYINYKLLFDYLAAKRIPIIWTLHDCWPFTGHCAYFDFAHCDRWKKGCYAPCPCKSSYPSSICFDGSKRNYYLKNSAFSSVDDLLLVPVSNWLKGLIDHSFLKSYPSCVIHNGIDLDVFRPISCDSTTSDAYGIKDRKVILGVANNWEARKGLHDFIKLRNLLDESFVIVLVGVNDKQRVSLPKGIIGINRTQNQAELARLYSLSDIFLNLTYEDNYPTTNLEAMACGTPVLTYRTGGSPESISPLTGWVVEKGDIQSVAGIVRRLVAQDKSDILEMRKSCRNRAEKEFNKTSCFNDYFGLYEDILSRTSEQ